VDFTRRERVLAELEETLRREPKAAAVARWLAEPDDGKIKLHMLAEGLRARKRQRDLFVGGEYAALKLSGAREPEAVAFMRRAGPRTAVVAAARFLSKRVAAADWGDTAVALPEPLAGRTLRDVFTGRELRPFARDGAAWLEAREAFSTLGAIIAIDEA
jgi:(1->4)-alpha-D-glucan 1-alpha-D-glucosylmutase